MQGRSCSHFERDGQIRAPDRIDVDVLQGDDAARRLVLVLRSEEVVQDSVRQNEPISVPLLHVPW